MNRVFFSTVWALPCLAVLAGLPAAAQAGTDMAISAEVRGGQIDSSVAPHPGTSVQWGKAVVLLDSPAADVMAVIQNYAGYKDFLPHFEVSRVLSQRGASALVYVQVSILHGTSTIWAQVKLRPRQGPGTTQIIEGKMTKGNMHLFEAVWEVTPVDAKHTLVAFRMLVDPDMPVPSSLVTRENQKDARKTLSALRDLLVQRKARVKA
jgi:ribosome-associated toxin RatA of RatAB toxin-antitoxin module